MTCDAQATCEGGVCSCNPGWEGDGATCADVDECGSGAAACAPDATCTNRPGGYDCACNEGYTGDGRRCVDVDECAAGSDACDGNAICTNTAGGHTCACKPGFVGDGVSSCADVNECAEGTDGCDPGADCHNTVGSYECTCRPPAVGDGTTCESPWSDPALLGLPFDATPAPQFGRAEMAADAAGNVYVAMTNHGQSIHVRRWDAGAAAWSELFDLTGSIFQAGNFPLIDVDAAGNALVVFHEANDWEAVRILAMRHDAAVPFDSGWSAEPEVVAGDDGTSVLQWLRRLEVDDAGNALVVVGALRVIDDEWRSLAEVRVAPAGAPFGPAVELPGVPDFASVSTRATAEGFRLLAAWAGEDGVFTLGGSWDRATGAWSFDEAAERHADRGLEAAASLDAAGGRFVTWQEGELWVDTWIRARHAPAASAWDAIHEVDVHPDPAVGAVVPETLLVQAGSAGEAQLLFRSADALGRTWGWAAVHRGGSWNAPIAVDADEAGTVAWIHGDRSASGEFAVVWDRRDENGDWVVFVRSSTDDGTLGPAVELATRDGNDRYWARILLREGGAAATWVTSPDADGGGPTTLEVAIFTAWQEGASTGSR